MTVVIPDETPLAQQRQQRLRLWLLLAPGALWLFFFFVLPLLIVMLYSFATPGPTGNVIWEFNFNSYITLMGKDLYFNAYYRSLWVGIQTTVICPCMTFVGFFNNSCVLAASKSVGIKSLHFSES